MKILLLFMIWLYRHSLGYFFQNSCRYLPSCSQYGEESIKKYGAYRGGWLTIKRILRCHPIKFLGGGSGYDPVP